MKITNNKEYKEGLKKLYSLMNKSEDKLSEKEVKQMETLGEAIEFYEDNVLNIMPLAKPTFKGIVLVKMKEKKISTQASLAKKLGMTASTLTRNLNSPTLPFVKSIHNKLGIDGNLLLEYA